MLVTIGTMTTSINKQQIGKDDMMSDPDSSLMPTESAVQNKSRIKRKVGFNS